MLDVSKQGYRFYYSSNLYSFEYAMFADKNFYEPNPVKPVVFVLRKNRTTEPLVQLSQDFPISTNEPTIIKMSDGDSTEIRVDLLQNQRGKDGLWSVRISAPGGGVQISTEEFPFEAPETGYEPSVILDSTTPKPQTWPGAYEGGELFVKTVGGYGRLHFQMLASATHFSIFSYYNPNGSRNLEP